MRVMVFVKATEDSEAGFEPSAEIEKMFVEMGRFNEELVKAGVLLAGDGLKPSNATRLPALDGFRPSPASMMPALTSSSLNLPISTNIFSISA